MRTFWISLLVATVLAVAWSIWPDAAARASREVPATSFDSDADSAPERPRTDLPAETAAGDTTTATPESEGPESKADETSIVASIEAESPATETPTSDLEEATRPEPLTLGLDASIPDATIIAGSIVRGPKSLLLADDRFEIEGDGSRENPFRVSWELLISAGENYRPRVGDRGIPQRIAMLDGKWVAIDGYVAFPMLVGTTSEALVMLNRWDGCCIGVPPSPYDAIEVKLDRPVVRTQMHAIDYGEVVGILEVEPYLVDDWLVGLYLMDDATLKLDL